MDQELRQLITNLEGLVGSHRDLLELVRVERGYMVEMDVANLEKVTHGKQLIIHQIQKFERQRQLYVDHLARDYGMNPAEVTLRKVAAEAQGNFPELASRLQSIETTLNLLIERIQTQSRHNLALVENSLRHIGVMKHNLLGEVVKTAETYTARGTKDSPTRSAHLFQKEV